MEKKKKSAAVRFFTSKGFWFVIAPLLTAAIVFTVVSILNGAKKAGSLKDFSRMDAKDYVYIGTGFINYKNGNLNYFDINNSKNDSSHNIGIDDSSLKIAGGSNIRLVYNERSFFVLGTNQTVDIENGKIIDCKCGKNFAAFLIEDTESGKSRIELYNSAGSLCNKKEYDETLITGFGFENEESSIFYTLELSTTGKDIAVTITTFDPVKNSVNGVLSVYGMVVENVMFTEKSIFVFGTKSLIRFDRKTNREAYRVMTYGYECHSVSMNKRKKQVFALTEANNKNSQYVKLLTVSEEESANSTVCVISLPENCLYFASMDGMLAAVTENSIIKYDGSGEKVGENLFDMKVSSAMKLNQNELIVTIGGKVGIFKLKRA